jgi:hypothetical protein
VGLEESGRKTFKIETQSTRLEQLNTGYNALASMKKKMMMMLFRILHAPSKKMKHDVFKREDIPLSIVVENTRTGVSTIY